ncbi:STAS domain-containing protein [Nocardioides piscis]|uniref:STAS domain-containing protein n=1 Tax=Nocardioides piscis TaxID=2714938 RepID=A0A6G7YGM1_9ACTN|nr:STAS domain-containing protein [Nocardioides piscis]QIK75920.1 STAS domain-containing protein [Nocardioides piscis]
MDITTDGPTLVLHGDFDVRSTFLVRNAIYEQFEGHERDVVLDMADVDTIDLTALRVLAVATLRAAQSGHHLTLRNCRPAVRRMIHLARFAHSVEVERAAATA